MESILNCKGKWQGHLKDKPHGQHRIRRFPNRPILWLHSISAGTIWLPPYEWMRSSCKCVRAGRTLWLILTVVNNVHCIPNVHCAFCDNQPSCAYARTPPSERQQGVAMCLHLAAPRRPLTITKRYLRLKEFIADVSAESESNSQESYSTLRAERSAIVQAPWMGTCLSAPGISAKRNFGGGGLEQQKEF